MSNETTATMNRTMEKESTKTGAVKRVNVRYITVTGMLSAIAFILMYFDVKVPFMPNFISLDISELPALIGAFAMGPVSGVIICLIKNLLHLTISSTALVGELSNFILGASFVFTAGMIYKLKKTKKGAVIGSFAGAIVMAVISVFSNYFVVYPFYYNFMSKDSIIAAYQAITPNINITNILQCLIGFNMPFTFVKGMISVVITLLIYKHISPLLKGRNNQ